MSRRGHHRAKPLGRTVHVTGTRGAGQWTWRPDRDGVRIQDPSGVLSFRVRHVDRLGWWSEDGTQVVPRQVHEFILQRVLPATTTTRGRIAWKPPLLRLMDQAGTLIHERPLHVHAAQRSIRMKQAVRQAEEAWRPGVFRATVEPGSEPPLPDRLAFDQRGRSELLLPWQRWEDVGPQGPRAMDDEEERTLARLAQAGDQAAAERLGTGGGR